MAETALRPPSADVAYDRRPIETRAAPEVPGRTPGGSGKKRKALAYQQVAREQDVPSGRGLCVQIDGIDVGLFRVGQEIHAMENRCPHAGDPLSEGRLEGSIVECRAHGWQFDVRTGFPPKDADGFPIPRFPVRITEGHVEVDLDAPLDQPPRRSSGDALRS